MSSYSILELKDGTTYILKQDFDEFIEAMMNEWEDGATFAMLPVLGVTADVDAIDVDVMGAQWFSETIKLDPQQRLINVGVNGSDIKQMWGFDTASGDSSGDLP